MARKSSITSAPLPVRKAIDDALKTGRFTLDQLLSSLRSEFGKEAVPSRSAIGRYAQRFEEVGKRLRESREVAQVWAERLGSEPQGDVGKLVMDMLRTLAFDATMTLGEPGEDGAGVSIDPKALNTLALAIQRLETAGRHNIEREKAMRQAVLAEAAKSADTAAREAGLSDEAIAAIRMKIMMGLAG
ncbi:DUF3486 family protein [Hydrocarboniphaga effusa]|uniref:DUF3486 family protein n=1 Tax=Hydrocarboniphaga effusa TaxID=243629 RepID=UPI003BABBCE1